MGNRFVVSIRTDKSGEKLSPFSVRPHFFYNLSHECIVFLWSILFVEDTALRITQSHATETVAAEKHKGTVQQII